VHVPYDVAHEEGFEDMERRVPDTTKLEALTGWRPTRSLDDIIAKNPPIYLRRRQDSNLRGSVTPLTV
jgi:hypothetical protein